MPTTTVNDMLVLSLGVISPDDPACKAAVARVLHQWDAEHPEATITTAAWTITNDPDKVRAWPVPHVCASCADGQQKAIDAAAAGATVALCHLVYEDGGF